MRLILAHASDAAAGRLAARWGAGALLLTPRQLRSCSWVLRLDTGGDPLGTVAAPGLGAPLQVDAVVCRLGGITAGELSQVCPEDREYAAAELTAFLFAWLTACRCPVLNPPGTGSLNGPGWQAEQWLTAAAHAGLAVRDAHRSVTLGAPAPAGPPAAAGGPGAEVTVVAGTCLGPISTANRRRLDELSRTCGAPLLRVTLDGTGPGAAVTGISAWPDIGLPSVARALESLLAA